MNKQRPDRTRRIPQDAFGEGAVELGSLRLNITGTWSSLDFSNLLLQTREVYLKVNALQYVTNRAARHYGPSSKHPRRDPYDSREIRPDFIEMYQSVVSSPLTYTADIYIRSLHYESPGWIEFLGSLNPLKVVADAINQWRIQNTLREKNKQDAVLKEMKLKLEFMKLIAQEAKPLRELVSNGDYERLVHSVLGPTSEILATVSKDKRITGVHAGHV